MSDSMTPTSPPATKGVTEALWSLHREEHRRLGQMLLDKTPEGKEASNWQGGRVNGIGAAIEALASLSLPPPGEGEAIRDQAISDCALAVWKELSGTPAYADAMHLAERAVRALRVSPAAPVKELEPGTVRVCPKRDATCPHGLHCPYTDGYDCKPGWNTYPAAGWQYRASPQGEKP